MTLRADGYDNSRSRRSPYNSTLACSKIQVLREANRRWRSDFVEVIENPVLDSLFEGPTRHSELSDENITDQIVEGRDKK